MWLDLEGGTLPAPGEEKDVRACASDYRDLSPLQNPCCVQNRTIAVKNCGNFLIYNINSTFDNRFSLAYCAE